MKRMLIDAAHEDETRVVILQNDRVQDYDFVTSAKAQVKGNIYLAKITRVEPSLQAAFVEYGGGKQGFLPFAEIHPDYYQLPAEDKQKLLAEQIAEAEAEEAAEEEAFEREQAARESRGRGGRGGRGDREEADDEFPEDEGFEADSLQSNPEPLLITEISESPAPVEAEPAADLPMPEVQSFTPPQPMLEVNNDSVAPMEATDYAIHSDAIDAMPEDSAPREAQNTEATASEEQAAGTTAEDGEETRSRQNRGDSGTRGIHRRYRIQEVIKRNQIVLVQVIKEERGNKGCSLTTYISLAGRSAVLMPNSPKGGGISRKITDRETRKRLKEVASEMRTHRGMSVIIRTAGLDRTKADIRRDYEYLVKLWNDVRQQTLSSSAPALIYEEGNLIKRSLRDLYSGDIEEVIVEGEEAFDEAKNFMKMLMPSNAARVKLYKENTPLFTYAGIEEQLSGMTEPQVKLPSGGYIVINPTEALISIDVNSGRSTSERNVEETALKTNLEAAAEVGRQMRLRDLAGLVVIDFIDMNYGKNRKAVERAMKDAVKTDRAKIALGRISMFGLLELSRQRMRPSIAESMGVLCPHCRGTGYIHSVETVGIQIIRTLEKEAASTEFAVLRVTTHPEAALHLLNEKRAMLQSIEQRCSVSIVIQMDASMITGNYRLIKVTTEGKEIAHEDGKQPRRNGRRGRRGAAVPASAPSGRTSGRERNGSLNFSDAVEPNDPNDIYVPEPGDDDDNAIIGAGLKRESDDSSSEGGERPRRERGERSDRGDRGNRERGGRNRKRGGRDRDRGPRPDAVVGEHGEATVAEVAPLLDENGNPIPRQPREPRGERGEGNRRRGRRGGRNRNRSDRPAPDGSIGNPYPTETGGGEAAAAVAAYASEPVAAPAAAHGEPKPVTSYQPRTSRVIPLSDAQTNPAAIASPIPQANSDKPKKKGWWSKVLES